MERIFFLTYQLCSVTHDGDDWVGITIGLENLKVKYKQTIEELRNAKAKAKANYDYDGHWAREDQLKVYEYTEEGGFSSYSTENLLE